MESMTVELILGRCPRLATVGKEIWELAYTTNYTETNNSSECNGLHHQIRSDCLANAKKKILSQTHSSCDRG
jgi:hypothetical protein